MNRAGKVSAGAWSALGTSGLLCAAVWLVTHQWQPIRSAADNELAVLASERDGLRHNDDQMRNALREQNKALARQEWTAEAIAGLQQRLGADWRWEPDPGGQPHRVILRRKAPLLYEWPRYVALVTELTSQPGLAVEAIEFLADGAARDRRFTRVTIGLRFTVAGAPLRDAERSAPSRGPLPVAAAAGPATPRQVGPVLSLRRPSASAEPPAPGQASAPFRSDPPGPKAGASPPNPPHNP